MRRCREISGLSENPQVPPVAPRDEGRLKASQAVHSPPAAVCPTSRDMILTDNFIPGYLSETWGK